MLNHTIHSLPEEERPRERLKRLGEESLSNAELLAIVLGNGLRGVSVLQLSQEILVRFGSLKKLTEATLEELVNIKGVGFAKAIQIKASLTLGLRCQREKFMHRLRLETPQQAYEYLKDVLAYQKQEHFVVILQDTKGGVITLETVVIGTLSRAIIHPREVFSPAIRHQAASIIMAHNHPSGDPTPSPQDFEMTKGLIEVGKIIGIPIHDHLIVAGEGFVSLRERGITFA